MKTVGMGMSKKKSTEEILAENEKLVDENKALKAELEELKAGGKKKSADK